MFLNCPKYITSHYPALLLLHLQQPLQGASPAPCVHPGALQAAIPQQALQRVSTCSESPRQSAAILPLLHPPGLPPAQRPGTSACQTHRRQPAATSPPHGLPSRKATQYHKEAEKQSGPHTN